MNVAPPFHTDILAFTNRLRCTSEEHSTPLRSTITSPRQSFIPDSTPLYRVPAGPGSSGAQMLTKCQRRRQDSWNKNPPRSLLTFLPRGSPCDRTATGTPAATSSPLCLPDMHNVTHCPVLHANDTNLETQTYEVCSSHRKPYTAHFSTRTSQTVGDGWGVVEF